MNKSINLKSISFIFTHVAENGQVAQHIFNEFQICINFLTNQIGLKKTQ